jgi:hypothetical protein
MCPRTPRGSLSNQRELEPKKTEKKEKKRKERKRKREKERKREREKERGEDLNCAAIRFVCGISFSSTARRKRKDQEEVCVGISRSTSRR